ncbi:MAG: sulfatase, partial [Verrucomicrobiota bacterium]
MFLRSILCLALLGCSLLFAESRPPNILWVIGENFSNDLGCYGQKNVSTPHLDQLAKEGLRYTHCFSTSPVCAPSRSCFMLGMYQTTTDTHHMRSHRDDDFKLPAGIRPVTQRLKEKGYRTANLTHIGDKEIGTGKLDLNFVNEGELYSVKTWEELTKGDAPFFGQVNMPEAEYDIYDRKTAEKPRVKWVGEEWHPQVATPENVTPPPHYPDHQIVREEWARYLNSVTGTDVRFGWIMDRLKADGLLEDTVVIFFSDNGRLMPRGIHWPFDEGLRVPMIIRWPKNHPAPPQIQAGKVSDQVISLLDLTATTLAIAGIPQPAGMQSRAFLGENPAPARQYAFAARDRIDETEVRMRSVHDDRYHYIRNFTDGAGFP